MNEEEVFAKAVANIFKRDRRFAPPAYFFLRQGLAATFKRLVEKEKGANPTRQERNGFRHITTREFLDGLCACALEQFGPLAGPLWARWGVRTAAHVGDMVFNLVDENVLARGGSDTRELFEQFDLPTALASPFTPSERTRAAVTAARKRSALLPPMLPPPAGSEDAPAPVRKRSTPSAAVAKTPRKRLVKRRPKPPAQEKGA